jgi:hypothetical protein
MFFLLLLQGFSSIHPLINIMLLLPAVACAPTPCTLY